MFSLWQSYKAFTPRTKALIGIGLMAYAAAGLYISNKAEEAFNMKPTEEDKKELGRLVPKIRVVRRDGEDATELRPRGNEKQSRGS